MDEIEIARSEDSQKSLAEAARRHEVDRIAVILVVVMVIAALCVALVGVGGYLGVVGVLILVGTAAATVGAALGFIFAIPRARDRAELAFAAARADTGDEAGTSSAAQSKAFLQTNSNLVRISDWLTTMLVGVGLTQLNQLHQTLRMFGLFLKEAYGACGKKGCPADVLYAVGPGVLVFGAFAGFLFMYLYTRLVLVQLLNNIEQDLQGEDEEIAPSISQQLFGRAPEASGTSRASGGSDIDDALKLMFAALYKDPPEGYKEALNIAGLLSKSAAIKRAIYWFYQAAAFGQMHAHLKEEGASEEELTSARDNALDCASRAIEIQPTMRAQLKGLTRAGGEDDLYSLRNDPSFVKLLGR